MSRINSQPKIRALIIRKLKICYAIKLIWLGAYSRYEDTVGSCLSRCIYEFSDIALRSCIPKLIAYLADSYSISILSLRLYLYRMGPVISFIAKVSVIIPGKINGIDISGVLVNHRISEGLIIEMICRKLISSLESLRKFDA